MKNMLIKEFCLAASPLSFIFLSFAFMTFIPGYPILCGGFFVCLGIFQSFQHSRENGDISYSLLLPISKADIVKARYMSVIILEAIALVLMTAVTALRMTVLSEAAVYVQNVMMPANPVFLSFVLMIFLSFNCLFVGGYFRTAYKFGKPFVLFAVVSFILVVLGETLHHIPGLEVLAQLKGEGMWIQYLILILSVLLFIIGSILSCQASQRRFEKLDF